MTFAQYASYALVALGIFTAYMALVSAFSKDKTLARSKKMAGVVFAEDAQGPSAGLKFADAVLGLMGIDVRMHRDLANQLAQAGLGGPAALSYFMFFKRVMQPILFVIGLILLAQVWFSSTPVGDNMNALGVGLLLVVVGAFGAPLYLSNATQHRRAALVRTFPEALDLLLICVESGLGIDAAFGKVCKELKSPAYKALSSEFERTRFEMSMLNDRAQALLNLGDRTDLPAFRSLVSSLVQAERFGTSLVETLRLISEEQRNERMMAAERKAARIPAMITVPLIFCILPALIIIILGPPLVKMMVNGGLPGTH